MKSYAIPKLFRKYYKLRQMQYDSRDLFFSKAFFFESFFFIKRRIQLNITSCKKLINKIILIFYKFSKDILGSAQIQFQDVLKCILSFVEIKKMRTI